MKYLKRLAYCPRYLVYYYTPNIIIVLLYTNYIFFTYTKCFILVNITAAMKAAIMSHDTCFKD